MKQIDYLTRGNLDYIESLFEQYRNNPKGLTKEWQMFFNGVELAQDMPSCALSKKELSVFQLITAYRDDGHLLARLNPLQQTQSDSLNQQLFDLKRFNLSEKDINKNFQISSILPGLKKGAPLTDILDFLQKTYCGSIGLQVGGCPPQIREWFFNEFEKESQNFNLSGEQKKNIFYELAKTEALEKFLHSRFVAAKRFSIEGSDALIPMLEYLAEQGTKQQVKELIIGMAHRGRLNVLNNFMNQASEIVFMEFDGGRALQHFDFDGDVKYHQGYSSVKKYSHGSCNVLLAYNPSHLEAVNPVVCGKVRARQRVRGDQVTRKAVIPVLIHGDAAFCGQGSVSETLQLSELEGYNTGGTLHIIVNNQIGFTTDPADARSCLYASDMAKAIDAPVLLVNADDVLSCIRCIDIALRFRQKFGRDIFIDLIGYRRYGHNEGDEPAFTQPLMYQKIKNHTPVRTIYADQMEKENLMSKKETDDYYNQQIQNLQSVLDKTRTEQLSLSQEDLKGTLWAEYTKTEEEDFFKDTDTCPLDKDLEKVLQILSEMPENFHLHPKIKKLIQSRQKMLKEDKLNWALCELAAYGTLCLENHPVRISGQDCKRGTFSHRHAVYFDTKNGSAYSPLTKLNPDKGEFCIYNSPLSEMAVLGFEYGNACADHSFFTLWEAQFGDFCNGAQIIIDQFISSGEEKWMQNCGLVLLLPHGYEGQGPEHSSARLERWLQLCAQENMQVCYPTTPANFFHLLRRQMKRSFRKPLIVMTPKSLLRHPKVTSSKKELIRSRGFNEVLADPQIKNPKQVQTLVLCSGKLFFDLDSEREKSNQDLSHIAFTRMEQLYPFPKPALAPYLQGYHKLKKVLWVQEEPSNMGANSYIMPKLRSFMDELGLEKLSLSCVSRTEKASPATGCIQTHNKEYELLIKNILSQATVIS